MQLSRANWAILTGLVNGAAGAVVAWSVVASAEGAGWEVVVPAAGLAVGVLTAWGCWWLLGRSWRRPWLAGLLLGIVVAVLAHPLTWYLVLVGSWLTGQRGSLGDPTIGPVQAIGMSFLYSLFSILIAGPLPVTVSVLICVASIWLRHRERRVMTPTGEKLSL